MRTIDLSLAAFTEPDLKIFKEMVDKINMNTIADLKDDKVRELIVSELPKYNGRALQTFKTIINTLHMDERDLPEAREFIDRGFMTENMEAKYAEIRALQPDCPLCGSGLTVNRIQHENENNFTMMLRCTSCRLHEEGRTLDYKKFEADYKAKVQEIEDKYNKMEG